MLWYCLKIWVWKNKDGKQNVGYQMTIMEQNGTKKVVGLKMSRVPTAFQKMWQMMLTIETIQNFKFENGII